jgi:hypothetical protein
MTPAVLARRADGDQITIAVPEGWAFLTVRVSVARRA